MRRARPARAPPICRSPSYLRAPSLSRCTVPPTSPDRSTPFLLKIFLSYPSDERAVAERIQYALLAQGHDVFFDREDLAAGHEYDQAISRAVDESDLFVFLVTPTSLTPGRYTLTELALAENKWPHASGRVLPVMLRPTGMDLVPAYLRAVNIFVPRGDAVAETALEVRRLAGTLPFSTRATRYLGARRRAAAGIGAFAVVLAVWLALGRPSPFGDRDAVTAPTPLPEAVRRRARAVAPMADGGFVVAAAAPNQILRFSPAGAPVGVPLALMGEPVAAMRTYTQLLVTTRAPDGVTVVDWKDLRIIDTIRLDAAKIEKMPGVTSRPRLSGDIQSVAIGPRGMLWAVTGDRDGVPAVIRFRPEGRRWEVPGWTRRPEGIFGPDARGWRLRLIKSDLWVVPSRTIPSALYRVNGAIRFDEFRGRDMRMLSCARDLAESGVGNLLVLSCENELQEIRVDGMDLALVSARPTLPVENAGDTWSEEMLIPDGARTIVALNTRPVLPNVRPGRARIAEVDSGGPPIPLHEEPGASIRSMAVTPGSVVAVLSRADGTMDIVRVPRPR